MSEPLTGTTTLELKNAPKKKNDLHTFKIKNDPFVYKTYRLSKAAITALELMTKRLSNQAKIKLAMGKVLELCIFNAEKMSIEELLR